MLLPSCLLGLLLFWTVVGRLLVLVSCLLSLLVLLLVLLLGVLLLLSLLVVLLGLLLCLLLVLLLGVLLLLGLLVVLLGLLRLRLLLVLLLGVLLLLGLLVVLLGLLRLRLLLGVLLLWLCMLLLLLLFGFGLLLFVLCERRNNGPERHKQQCRSESAKCFHWNCLNYRLDLAAANRCILLTAACSAQIRPLRDGFGWGEPIRPQACYGNVTYIYS